MLKRIFASLLMLALYSCGTPVFCHAQYATLTGTLQGANGLPASNYSISFTPSQFGFISGTSVIINTTTACATSVDGSVVGLPNPLQGANVTTGFTGTLPAANYYVVVAWYDASGNLTLVSPETVIQLNSTGRLIVALPSSGLPAGASGMKVYVSTSTGTETLQGQSTGTAAFVLSVPLTSGAAVPSTNNTVCKQVANDAIWPSGTGYTVALTDPDGNTLPGYPMMWQLMGPNTTINLSNGLPYYHGTVYYPTPILASPLNHNLQSISGPLSLSGYDLTSAGHIGVGTSNPAWPVDVENGAVNASGGFILNGGSGVTTGQCLLADSDTFHTFRVTGTCVTSVGTIYYQTVRAAGTPLTQRPFLNFLAPLTAVDNSGATSTDVGLAASGVTPGAYTSPSSITFDTYGRATAVTASSAVNRTCSGSTCYVVFPDGTIYAWGNTTSPPSSGSIALLTGTFPVPFTTTTGLSVSVSPVGQAIGDGNPHPIECHVNVISTTGITAYISLPVQVGGSGYGSLSSSQYCSWIAIGH